MAAMVEQTCRCGTKFMARAADVKRGWGKSCSKSCAANRREYKLDREGRRSGGQRRNNDMLAMAQRHIDSNHISTDEDFDDDDPSWDAHKSY